PERELPDERDSGSTAATGSAAPRLRCAPVRQQSKPSALLLSHSPRPSPDKPPWCHPTLVPSAPKGMYLFGPAATWAQNYRAGSVLPAPQAGTARPSPARGGRDASPAAGSVPDQPTGSRHASLLKDS